jgi:uncharacterized membrane protein
MSEDKQHNGGADGSAGTRNVLAVSFDPDNNAYAALSTVKELDAQSQLGLQAAAVVLREENGEVVVKDQIGSDLYMGAASGGLLGLLLGVVGGPLGVLIGGTYGVLVGSLVDLGEVEDSESVLTEISASMRPGHTALVAEVLEQSPEVVDTAMKRLGGTVLRRPVADVEAEIAAAEKAQRKAQREATKELVHERHERTKEQVHAKLDELRAKRPQREKTSA